MKTPNPLHPSRGGSVLLVTLLTVSLLLVVVLTFVVTVRLELRKLAEHQVGFQARGNARLGVELALASLQELLGPDQRISAPAEILAATDPGKALWTGVWDTSAVPPAPAWLVSRANPAVAPVNTSPAPATPDANHIELVGDRTTVTDNPARPGSRIIVPAQPISAGKVAWWVGDEGIKARVNLHDPWAETAAATRIHSWQSAQRADIGRMRDAGGNALGTAFPARGGDLRKLLELRQLALPPFDLAAFGRLRFHDLSAHSRGVLADTARGGLKKDLSAWLRHPAADRVAGAPADSDLIFRPQDMGVQTPSAADAFGMPTWALIRDFHNTRSNGVDPIVPRFATSMRQGIHPVVTLARLGFAIEARVRDPLRLHFFPTVVLWNPHSVPLAPGLYEFGMFQHRSTAWFEFIGVPSETSLPETPLGQLSLYRGSFPSESGPQLRPFPFRILVEEPIPPGESWVFSVHPDDDGAAYNRDNPRPLRRGNHPQNTLVMEGTALVPVGTTEVRWAVRGTPSAGETMPSPVYRGGQVNLMLRPVPSPVPSDWPAFQGYDQNNSSYQSVTRIGHGSRRAPSPTPVSISPLGPVQPSFGIALRHKMGDINTEPQQRWIAGANPRAQLSLNEQYDHFIDRSGNATDLAFLTFDGYRASSGLRVNNQIPAEDAVLAEILPSDVPFSSLAQLQNANLSRIHSYPGNAVGNALHNREVGRDDSSLIQRPGDNPTTGGDPVSRMYDVSYGLNRALWDRYFLSTLPATMSAADLADPGYSLPNARHRLHRRDAAVSLTGLLGPVAFDSAASHLLVEGAFNINSTSVEAWRALLASANGLEYNPQTRADGPALENPFSRFAVPLGGLDSPWTGYRSLSDTQLDALARAIVGQVRARGPFLSLADFINRTPSVPAHAQEGALQAALDISGVNPASGLATGAAAMITQADLLTAIGPVISARSDTFLIRSYGESTHTATGAPQGRAWAEAIVQRLPEYMDPALSPDPAAVPLGTNQTFGRRFAIIAFRWISQDEI